MIVQARVSSYLEGDSECTGGDVEITFEASTYQGYVEMRIGKDVYRVNRGDLAELSRTFPRLERERP